MPFGHRPPGLHFWGSGRRLSAALLLSALPFLPITASAAPAPGLTPANSALYIANSDEGSILRCNGATGKVLATFGNNLNPAGLAIGPDHKILYVTSFDGGTVSRFSLATGKSLGTFIPQGRGGLAEPVTMAFGPDGNLYVGNWRYNDIRRFDGRTGAFLGVFAKNGSGGLAQPGDIMFGPDGDLYVTNNSVSNVLRFNGRTGAFKSIFVKAGSGGLVSPQNMAFGATGSLFVGGPAGVLQYSRTGAFVRVFAAPSANLESVGGLTFGPDGNLYVSDWQKNDVVRYNRRTGTFQGVFVKTAAGLMANKYILFGPRGGGGSPPIIEAARAKKMRAMQAAADAAQPVLLAAGTPAPDFAAIAPDGTTVHLSDYKGKPVILDFWATWCGPCQHSMPHLEKVYQQVQDKGVAVLGVCVWDEKAAYTKWLADKKGVYTFPTAFDPAGRGADSIAGSLYKVSGIPTQYLIDKDGNVAAVNVGYDDNDHRLEAALTKMGVPVADQEADAAK